MWGLRATQNAPLHHILKLRRRQVRRIERELMECPRRRRSKLDEVIARVDLRPEL